MSLNRAVQTLTSLPAGTRVVVRYRIEEGLTDALGYLRSMSTSRHTGGNQPGAGGECVVETRRGNVVIALDTIEAAKEIPPPPARRG